jgi:hypothetical protein
MKSTTNTGMGERGAASIKTVLAFLLIGVVVFSLIKVAPIYTEQRQIIYDLEELASKVAVRNSKEDEVKTAIEVLRRKYDLPENSIKLNTIGQNRAEISLAYTRAINFIVTTYDWKVDYKASGKAL